MEDFEIEASTSTPVVHTPFVARYDEVFFLYATQNGAAVVLLFKIRVRVRRFVVTGGHKGIAVCTAALRKEETEEWHLGCGWKEGCAARVRVRDIL